MESIKQNRIKKFLGGFSLFNPNSNTSIDKSVLARAMLSIFIILFFAVSVSAADITMQEGNMAVDGNLTVANNITTSSWFNGLFNWSISSSFLSWTGSILGFNSAKLNATIKALPTGNTTTEINAVESDPIYSAWVTGLTSTVAELNVLDGITSTTAELNKLDGYTGTAANLNTLTADSMADALHRHSELSASDGTPNPAVYCDSIGRFISTEGITINAGEWLSTDQISEVTGGHGIEFNDQAEILAGNSFTCDEVTENHRAYFQAQRSTLFDITNANTWYDYPWTVTADEKVGFTHTHDGANPEQITITNAGVYQISWDLTFQITGSNPYIAARLLKSGTEIPGSYRSMRPNSAGPGYYFPFSGTAIFSATAGQVIELQLGSTQAGLDVTYIDTATLPNPTTFTSASISIFRIGVV